MPPPNHFGCTCFSWCYNGIWMSADTTKIPPYNDIRVPVYSFSQTLACNFILNQETHGWIKKLWNSITECLPLGWIYGFTTFTPPRLFLCKFVTVFESQRLIYFDKPNVKCHKCSVISLVSRFYNSGFIPCDRPFKGLHFCLQILLPFLRSEDNPRLSSRDK